MGMGARSSEQWREHRALLEAISRNREEAPAPASPLPPEPVELPSRWRELLTGGVIALAAIIWIATLYTAYSLADPQTAALRDALPIVATASGPLALLGIAFMLLQRSSTREAKRFADTAKAMRSEAANLEQVLGMLSHRIEDNRRSLSEHAHQLLLLGEDSTMRLAEISTMMHGETMTLAGHAEKLEEAATTARNDLAVLVTDIPRIDDQVRALSVLLREAGLGAHEQAGALEAQLSVLAARGREADEQAGGAAQRLAAHIARIDSTIGNASQQMDQAATRMTTAVDDVLGNATEAVETTRRSLETQSAALLALVEQSGVSLDRIGTDAAIALNRRIDEISGRLDALGVRLKAQDSASQALIGGLDKGLDDLDRRFATLDEAGGATSGRLAASLAALREQAEGINGSFADGDDAAAALAGRIEALQRLIDAAHAAIDGPLPQALTRVEEQTSRGHDAIRATLPDAERLEDAIRGSTERIEEADAALMRQRAAFDSIGQDALDRLGEIERQSEAIEALFRQTDQRARQLAEQAGPQLVDALLRVRETAVQAAERAREALVAVIPEAAASLGEASRAAMERAFDERIEQQITSVSAASERAIQAANRASERLMRQMITIADTTSQIEARIDEHRQANAAEDEDNLARRVALLIESLNSTAIDVTKLLSNDVTDSAWAAYLKGDRGVFTRRAVRLLDSAEQREIVRHYENEPEFREQVNRYIHDFEAMLRRVLATRDGSPLSIALLSSDMGKLYVALAQAIERLRMQ